MRSRTMRSRWQVRGITAAAVLSLGAAGGLAMAQAPAPAASPGTAATPPAEASPGAATDSGSAVSKSDQKFVRRAAQGGLAEVQLGQLAQQQGTSDAVKQFGQRMVTDHQAANQKLQTIAQQENVQLPTSLSKHDQKELDKLQSLHGAAFDKAYARDMRMDHRKDILEFEHEAKHGKDAQVKQFADSTLPTLKEHLAMAKKLKTSSREASASETETSPSTR